MDFSPNKKPKLSREYTGLGPQGCSKSFSVRRDTSSHSTITLPKLLKQPSTTANLLSSLDPELDTVMAEQHGHNVVDAPKSAGGALPVDVSANTITTDPAASGTISTIFKNNNITPGSTNEANPSITKLSDQAADKAVEPSAGEAVLKPTQTAGEEKGIIGQIESTNNGQADYMLDDGSVRSGSVDPSMHSDTENSKGDASEAKEAHRHVRTNSVKKPTTFSKVSVTKNFMAKSAATPTMAKAGEKGTLLLQKRTPLGEKRNSQISAASPAGPSAAPAAKPRLVAKSGAAIANAQKARQSNQPSPGPDANTVWNKNRPVAPPPPKQFTDEELKQQYGIHLATRLQSDENGKESKWADIDDDEEDWAPEAVVWMDGTKSTLAAAEEPPAPAKQEAKPDAPAVAKPAEEENKSDPVANKPTEPAGPPKTILKPGAAAAKLHSSPATTPSSEKPTLKAKSPAPTPAKSPWAALPPVDRVSPIVPPVQQAPKQPTPFASQDARAYESSAPPPAREMAADTFDRWESGRESGHRELFNSSNGRYEPAPEGRRSSMRPDTNFRKPSIMQRNERGSQKAMSPAEPSAHFQTRRESQNEGSFSRRRGSSVSHGSIPPGRRMSMSKGPEMPDAEARPGSVVGQDLRSPQAFQNEAPVPPKLSQQNAWQQHMPPPPPAGAEPEEDPYEKQQRLMKEKTAAARKRRQEVEDREAAERKQRIEAKMAALGGAGKSRAERQAEAEAAKASALATAKSETKPETESTQVTKASAEAAPSLEAQVAMSAEADTTPMAPASEQPMPEELALPSPIPSKPQDSTLLSHKAPSADEIHHQSQRDETVQRSGLQQQSSPYKQPLSAISSPGPASERKLAPLGRSPLGSDAMSSWPSTASRGGGNVWGSAGIGNGTFENSSAFAPMFPQQGASLPPPIGMGRPSTSTRISPGFAQPSQSPGLQGSQPEQRTFGPQSLDSQPDVFNSQARVNGVSPGPGMGRQAHVPGPIAPPSRAQPAVQKPDPISAWNLATTRLPHELEEHNRQARIQALENPSPRPVMNATFRETKVGKLGGPRRTEKLEHMVYDSNGARRVEAFSPELPKEPVPDTQPPGPFTATTGSPVNTAKPTEEANNTVRIPDGSQNPAHGGSPMQPQAPIAPPGFAHQQPLAQSNLRFNATPLPPVQTRAASPPPPETLDHPVSSGDDLEKIAVKLPKERPTVKLPPPPEQAAGVPSPQQYNPALPPQRHVVTNRSMGLAGPIAQNAEWQKRFNGLFGRTAVSTEIPPSPPGTPPKNQDPALAVTSSTKTVMDDAPERTVAYVSLPLVLKSKTKEGFWVDRSNDIVSKPPMEQMFSEELSFGSLPHINIPTDPQYSQDLESAAPNNMLEISNHSKFPKPVQAHTKPDALSEAYLFVGNFNGIHVRMPGASSGKLVRLNRAIHKTRSDKKTKKANKENAAATSTNTSNVPAPSNPTTSTGTGGTQPTTNNATVSPSTPPVAPAASAAPAKKRPLPHEHQAALDVERAKAEKKTWAKPPKGEKPPRGQGYRGRGGRGRGGANPVAA